MRNHTGPVATIGLDIGKNTFHVVGLAKRGTIALRIKVSRSQLVHRLVNLPPCLVALEAGSGSHNIARQTTFAFIALAVSLAETGVVMLIYLDHALRRRRDLGSEVTHLARSTSCRYFVSRSIECNERIGTDATIVSPAGDRNAQHPAPRST